MIQKVEFPKRKAATCSPSPACLEEDLSFPGLQKYRRAGKKRQEDLTLSLALSMVLNHLTGLQQSWTIDHLLTSPTAQSQHVAIPDSKNILTALNSEALGHCDGGEKRKERKERSSLISET